jgi:hypothetical protein
MSMQTTPRRTNGHDTVIELRVDDGWAVEDLQTCEECDEARLVLTETIARIEEQLLEAKQRFGAKGEYAPSDWYNGAAVQEGRTAGSSESPSANSPRAKTGCAADQRPNASGSDPGEIPRTIQSGLRTVSALTPK